MARTSVKGYEIILENYVSGVVADSSEPDYNLTHRRYLIVQRQTKPRSVVIPTRKLRIASPLTYCEDGHEPRLSLTNEPSDRRTNNAIKKFKIF